MDTEVTESRELEGHKVMIFHAKFVNGVTENFEFVSAEDLSNDYTILKLHDVREKSLAINKNNILYFWITEKGE